MSARSAQSLITTAIPGMRCVALFCFSRYSSFLLQFFFLFFFRFSIDFSIFQSMSSLIESAFPLLTKTPIFTFVRPDKRTFEYVKITSHRESFRKVRKLATINKEIKKDKKRRKKGRRRRESWRLWSSLRQLVGVAVWRRARVQAHSRGGDDVSSFFFVTSRNAQGHGTATARTTTLGHPPHREQALVLWPSSRSVGQTQWAHPR